jgi:hypothetical protein
MPASTENEREQYIRQLEDAAHILWGEMPIEQCELLQQESPTLIEFLRHLHHQLGHEQAMVRKNVWAEEPSLYRQLSQPGKPFEDETS